MRALPITISADGDSAFGVTVADQHATLLGWEEMIGLVAVLTHAEIRTGRFGISKAAALVAAEAPCVPRREAAAAAEAAGEPEPAVLRMEATRAANLAAQLRELATWLDGFRACAGDDSTRMPPRSVDALSDVAFELSLAAVRARGDDLDDAIPF
ncbi:hypothetical protein [Methylobacterium sp. ID0610]|uniref:hypothetical protein n=1 Tax=Methylobacterium carpenticola TaxID=3344827 RepID=UPI0036C53E88